MAHDITRYNDRKENRDLSLFDDFFDSMLGAWGSYSSRVPAVDVEENPESYIIKAELPGYSEKDVKITVDNHVLRISGSVEEKEDEKDGKKYLVRERRHESFERSFSLPDGLDESAITADFENGVLSITMPKVPEVKPRQIEVKIGK